jgi:hypothetical protein
MEFLKRSEIELNSANYLVSKVTGNPVTHAEFVGQQKAAEYMVKLAAAVRGKNFKPGKVDNLQAIKNEVMKSITQSQTIQYVEGPAQPKSKVQDEVVKYALDFAAFQGKKDSIENINKVMNNYNKINDVETVGEYFTEGLVKLNKIYTIDEILDAVNESIDKLD